MTVVEFNVWAAGAPFLAPGGDGEFSFWSNGAPLLEPNRSNFSYPDTRRRPFIF